MPNLDQLRGVFPYPISGTIGQDTVQPLMQGLYPLTSCQIAQQGETDQVRLFRKFVYSVRPINSGPKVSI